MTVTSKSSLCRLRRKISQSRRGKAAVGVREKVSGNDEEKREQPTVGCLELVQVLVMQLCILKRERSVSFFVQPRPCSRSHHRLVRLPLTPPGASRTPPDQQQRSQTPSHILSALERTSVASSRLLSANSSRQFQLVNNNSQSLSQAFSGWIKVRVSSSAIGARSGEVVGSGTGGGGSRRRISGDAGRWRLCGSERRPVGTLLGMHEERGGSRR